MDDPISSFISGVGASVTANLLQGIGNLIPRDGVKTIIEQVVESAKKDFVKEYPDVKIDDVFLARQENIDKICDWILNNNVLAIRPILNLENYSGSKISKEQEEFFFIKMEHHIKNDEKLRQIVMYEIIKGTFEKVSNDALINNNVFAKSFVEQVRLIGHLFEKCFGFSLYDEHVQYDVNNFIYSANPQSLNACFVSICDVYNNIAKERIDDITKKQGENPIESLVCLFKTTIQDRSTEVSSDYNASIKYIVQIVKGISKKGPEYYNALGRMQIDSDCNDGSLYAKVMNELIAFNIKIINLLKYGIREMDIDENNKVVLSSMNKYLFYRIRNRITNSNRGFIKEIYTQKMVDDVGLANVFSIGVETLRNELYPLTSDLLRYSYGGGASTIIRIHHSYISMIEEYYAEIFGDGESEQ